MSWEASPVLHVREHPGVFKAANGYDVLDQHGQLQLTCTEEKLNWLNKAFRYGKYKRILPFRLQVRDRKGHLVMEVSRGFAFLRSTVKVHLHDGSYLGSFQQIPLSSGGAFQVLDRADHEVGRLLGHWRGRNYRVMDEQKHWATITKVWNGFVKELFTTADDYRLEVDPQACNQPELMRLMLASVLCIDMVLKE